MNKAAQTGRVGEGQAVAYLVGLGWRIVERNWRYGKVGEIDIIGVEPSSGRGNLVFCEVKARSGRGYGDPLEAITYAKLARLHRLARAWMATHETGYQRVRIDAIGVLIHPGGRSTITHVEGVQL